MPAAREASRIIRDLVTFFKYHKHSITLTRQALQPKGYPINPKNIGEYIRKTRIDLKLTQKQVGTLLEVLEATITNWELSKTTLIQKNHIANINDFLKKS